MQFIIELLDKLAWPLVFVFCVLMLQKPIARLIPLARKLKFKDFEVEFGQELKAVSKHAQGAFPELKQNKKAILIASVGNLPSSSILEAWREVDDAAENLIVAKLDNVDLESSTRYKLIEETLISQHLVDTKKAKLFNELRQLRNKVAHAKDYQVGKLEAVQYIELCFVLVDHFNQLLNQESRAHNNVK
ncbi:HEPN domain-containing protein [Shewanella sp. 10N.286.52.A9]|uniref:HEPN domain-containing protein n=1 Tax=Shewanella sp. 10N.286.52.A9 TaxID=3229711 RepID=UPI003553ABD7